MQKRNLIINADDLGLTDSVSLGIEDSYRSGLVTSASLMANMDGFPEGVQVALRNPDLGIGVHLNLIRGKPLGSISAAAPLIDSNGNFIDSIYRIGRLSANIEYQKAAEEEYRNQIERVLDSCIRPDHLDFEKHHGIWRPLYNIALRLAKEYKLAIRCYNEPLYFATQHLPFAGASNLWTSLHLKTYTALAHRDKTISKPDYFFGQTHIGSISKKYLEALITNLPYGTSELMTHPGRAVPDSRVLASDIGASWITNAREGELSALTDNDIIEKMTTSDINLTIFKEGLSS